MDVGNSEMIHTHELHRRVRNGNKSQKVISPFNGETFYSSKRLLSSKPQNKPEVQHSMVTKRRKNIN